MQLPPLTPEEITLTHQVSQEGAQIHIKTVLEYLQWAKARGKLLDAMLEQRGEQLVLNVWGEPGCAKSTLI